MNRFLQIFNFVGVLALTGLCAVQWNTNARIDHERDTLQQTTADQATKISVQEKTLSENSGALEDLRNRLSISESAEKDGQSKLTAMTSERDQLKASLDKWTAAVAQRDDALKQAGDQIQKLSKDRDDVVAKYNDLVTKFNAEQANGHSSNGTK